MKADIQYINDSNGKTRAVIVPINDWEKVVKKMTKYEQALKIKSDLTEAFAEVETLRKSTIKKKTLSDFLHEL